MPLSDIKNSENRIFTNFLKTFFFSKNFFMKNILRHILYTYKGKGTIRILFNFIIISHRRE